MVDFRWIQKSLFLMLMLQSTAAATRQLVLSSIVRSGDEVTLSCENVMNDLTNCGSTTWTFTDSRNTAAVELIKLGQIGRDAKAKSNRLRVTANCSLLIEEVTAEDVGRYFCQQYDSSGQKQRQDSQVYLSLINMTEERDTDKVTLNCSLSTNGRCTHKAKWLMKSNDVDGDNRDVKTSESPCSASVKFLTSHYIYESRFDLFKCEVTDGFSGEVRLFPFGRRRPDEDSIKTTTTGPPPTEVTRTNYDASTKLKGGWWLFVIAAVVLVALLIIVVKVIRWKRTKGNKTRMNDNVALTSNPEVTQSAPETSQDTANPDPEEGVSYASVSYTKKTNSKAQVRPKNVDDEGDAVTYATVKASYSGPSSVYATIN